MEEGAGVLALEEGPVRVADAVRYGRYKALAVPRRCPVVVIWLPRQSNAWSSCGRCCQVAGKALTWLVPRPSYSRQLELSKSGIAAISLSTRLFHVDQTVNRKRRKGVAVAFGTVWRELATKSFSHPMPRFHFPANHVRLRYSARGHVMQT